MQKKNTKDIRRRANLLRLRRAGAGRVLSIMLTAVMLLALFPAAANAGTAQSAAAKGNSAQSTAMRGRIDALSYKMNLRLDTKKDRLYETVSMRIKNKTNRKVRTLYLRNMSAGALQYAKEYYAEEGNGNKKSRISRVSCENKTLAYTTKKGGSTLKVRLGKKQTLKPGQCRTIVVRMYTDIPNRQDRFAVQKTSKGKVYALSFCFPYLADNQNGKWILDPFFDDGESRSYDLADYNVTFKAPAKYTVAATGTSKTTKSKKMATTKIRAHSVRDFAIVASDMMKKDSFKVCGVRVNNYYLNGKYKKAYRSLSKMTAKDSIKLFSKKVGKFPYDELDMTECLFGMGFGGMEYPGLIMLNGSAYFDGMGPTMGAWGLAMCTAHEIGHQWFYAAVGNCEYREGWLDEGFTTYLETEIYNLADCPSTRKIRSIDKDIPSIASMRNSWKGSVDYYKVSFRRYAINIAPNHYPKGREYGDAEYDGGYSFLCDVRQTMGKTKFNRFLREYYSTYKGRKATTKKVVKLIRKYDNSRKMNKVIRFWIR